MLFFFDALKTASMLKVFDFKRLLICKKSFLLLFIVVFLYFISDGSVVDFLKQLSSIIIIPYLISNLGKNK